MTNPVLDHLLTRRSVKVNNMAEPSPDSDELRDILTAATRVPDHGKLAPWRIKVLDKSAQAKLGDIFAERFIFANPDANDKQIEFERQRPQRAPLLLTVLYTPAIGRIPEWEQQLSAGAACMNILHATHALGYCAQWLTEWPAFDSEIKYALCGTLEDKIAGFIYIGTASEKPDERARPIYDEVVEEWKDCAAPEGTAPDKTNPSPAQG